MNAAHWALALYAAAMAYVEAAVVVYLRRLFHPEGFRFPLQPIPHELALTEIGREAATLAMIASVAWLGGSSKPQRWGAFCLVFGVWDILYYASLKVLIGWPESLLDPDILFLIPSPWVGPVIAPVGVSVLLIRLGLLYHRPEAGRVRAPSRLEWGLLLGGAALVLASFIGPNWGSADFSRPVVYPRRFGWGLFLSGWITAVAGVWRLSASRPR